MRARIRISNKDLLYKLKGLYHSKEVVLNNNTSTQKSISRIMKSINNKNKVIERHDTKDKILLKRLKPINFNLTFRSNR